ncbi:MAG: TrkA family potassium uptake protein [Bacteroidetes bacterium]|nr:MAG: TrkA family potassium uptake protein [Bacteroidota bacterium]
MDKRIKIYTIWGAIAIVFMFVLDYVLLINELGVEGSNIQNYEDAVWYMIVTLTSVGYGDIVPVTIIGRIIGYFFIISSLLVLGALISSISSNIIKMIEEKKLGFRGTEFTNHIICIGWNDFNRMVVDEVLEAERKVAIITSRKDEVDLIYNQYGKKNVFVLYSDLHNLESISKTNPDKSSEVFLSFDNDTESLIYVINFKKKYPEPNIVVAIENHNLKDTFHSAGVKYVVARNEIASKLVASYVFEPEVADLTIDLMSSAKTSEDFDNQQYLVISKNPFLNKNYDDAFVKLKIKYNIVLLGIVKHGLGENQLLVNAQSDTIIELNDYLIVMVGGKSKARVEKLFGIKEGKICCIEKT